MLSQLVKALEEENGRANLIKGFKKCGIVSIDVTPLLARIPGPENFTKQDDVVAADQSLINILTELHSDGPKGTKKSKRIAVTPEKSVSVEDIENQQQRTKHLAALSNHQRRNHHQAKLQERGKSSSLILKEMMKVMMMDGQVKNYCLKR